MKAKIIVDHREQAPELIEELQTRHGFVVEIGYLKWGDYKIQPDTVVERKTVRDFSLSILDGRLFRQAYRLAELTDNPVLLIEGPSFSMNNKPNIRLESIKGALITLAQTYRLPVLRTKDQLDSAWYIKTLYLQRRRIGQNSGVLRAYLPKQLTSRKINVLRSLPGIGKKLAETLLDEYESVENVIKAPAEDLRKVPGLGPKKVEKIIAVLREDSESYGL